MASNQVRGVRSPVPAGMVVGSNVSQGSGPAVFTSLPNPYVQIPQAGSGIHVDGNVVSLATSGSHVAVQDVVVNLSGDVSGSGGPSGGSTATVNIGTALATVNPDVGTFQGLTVNGKGLVTAAVNESYLGDPDWSFTSHVLLANYTTTAAPVSFIPEGIQLAGTTNMSVGLQINTFVGIGRYTSYRADGTPASPAAIAGAEGLMLLSGGGYDGSVYASSAVINFRADQAWSTTAHGTQLVFSVTPDNTTTTTNALTIQSSGGVSLGAGADPGAGGFNATSAYKLGGTNIQTGKGVTTKTVSSPGSVTATSPTYKMLGLAGAITPTWNGQIMFTVTGSCSAATTATTVTLVLSYGTGVAPSNGGTLAGTQMGAVYAFEQAVGGYPTGFCLAAVVTGLTAGTAYWLDLAVGDSAGTAVTFGSTNVSAHEV